MESKKDLNHQMPSELVLEKFVLGELSPEEAAVVSKILDVSPGLQEKLDQIRKSNQDLLKKYPSDLVGKRVRNKLKDIKIKKRNLARMLWMLAPIPVAAMLLITAGPGLRHTESPTSEERTKGIGTALQIYRKNGETLEKLAHGETVRPRDLVQLSYSVEKRKYGAIVSVDGGRQVTLHWPEKSGPSPLLEMGREMVLPSSFELDESPSFETFVLITSDQPFEVDQIISSAKSGRMDLKTGHFEIDVPQGLQQFVITLRK